MFLVLKILLFYYISLVVCLDFFSFLFGILGVGLFCGLEFSFFQTNLVSFLVGEEQLGWVCLH
jgi:hypothetical protein